VVADLGFLDSLPSREIAAGMAEVVKAGLIADAALLDTLEAQAGAAVPAETLAKVNRGCRPVKVDVVVADERESGRRAISTSATPLATPSRPHPDSNFCTASGIARDDRRLGHGVARGVTEPRCLRA